MQFYVKKPYETLWDYLVEIPGGASAFVETGRKVVGEFDYYAGEYQKGVLPAPPIYNQTGGLAEEGIVVKSPSGLPNLTGRRVRFSYLSTDKAMKGGYPAVIGHVLVSFEDMIMVVDPDEMIGEWLWCSSINFGEDASGLIFPKYNLASYDTAKGMHVEGEERHLDKGIVHCENQHFRVGTPVLFKSPDYADKRWAPEGVAGFLIKKRNVIMAGPSVYRMEHIKQKLNRKILNINK